MKIVQSILIHIILVDWKLLKFLITYFWVLTSSNMHFLFILSHISLACLVDQYTSNNSIDQILKIARQTCLLSFSHASKLSWSPSNLELVRICHGFITSMPKKNPFLPSFEKCLIERINFEALSLVWIGDASGPKLFYDG